MSRINTNIPSLTAQHDLAKAQKDLTTSLRRLSSGVKINSAADDPAGLIISELLRGETASINRAISNTQRAANIIATAEGGLNEVNSLLIDIRDKVVEAASSGALTPDEISANQLQIDSAVRSINRIANSTVFGGRALLNGNLDYVTSSVPTTAIQGIQVYAAQFGTATNISVSVTVKQKASAAQVAFNCGATTLSAATSFEVIGNKGSEILSFVISTTLTNVMNAVNAVKDTTGVSAKLSGTAIKMNSVEAGLDQFVSVNVISGAFVNTTVVRDQGSNANILVNGQKADVKGNTVSINTVNLQARFDIKSGATLATSKFYIKNSGALFQIGRSVDVNGQYNIGITSTNAGRLGRSGVGFLNQITTGGAYSLAQVGGATQSAKIVDEAIMQVSTLRGRLGALQRNTFDTNINSLRVSMENVTSAQSDIRDTDFAKETAQMTRAEILVSAGTSVLQTSNRIPQNVLALLGR